MVNKDLQLETANSDRHDENMTDSKTYKDERDLTKLLRLYYDDNDEEGTSLQTSMLPKTTWSPSKKLSPTMMTVVPPDVQPSLGQIALTDGVAAEHRKPATSPTQVLKTFVNAFYMKKNGFTILLCTFTSMNPSLFLPFMVNKDVYYNFNHRRSTSKMAVPVFLNWRCRIPAIVKNDKRQSINKK